MNNIGQSLSPMTLCRGLYARALTVLFVFTVFSVMLSAACGRAYARSKASSAIPTQGTPTFYDRFDTGELDTSKWNIATYKSPDSKPGINAGLYTPEKIDFSSGMLRISVEQTRVGEGVRSLGGAIFSKERFGYGTYEFVMRMTSPSLTPDGPGETQTGAVSSGFLYYTNSASEIDLEFVGDQNVMWVTTWDNSNGSAPPTSGMKRSEKLANRDLATGFHTYTLVWEPERIRVFIDDVLATTFTENIPSVPAHIILQHRGTNSRQWGGLATIGVTRYAYFRSVKFTPMGGR
jgi:beta-glucanase (GH16 family)